MANAKKPGEGAPQDIQLKVEFEGQPEAGLDVSAYLFDTQGKLIASAPVVKGAAKLRLERMPRRSRLLIGPKLAKERAPTVAMLERLNAYAPPWRFEPSRAVYELPPIPDFLWPHWPLCRCRVRGRVVKRVVSPGGVVVEAPVCNARVHICEVDRLWWIIERIPDDIIRRIRDDLLVAIRKPFPWPPEPDPFNRIDDLIDISPETQRIRNRASAAQLFGGSRHEEVALNPQPLPPVETLALVHGSGGDAGPLQLAAETKLALASRSTQVVRQALLDNLALLRPWICSWEWLHPWFYRCDELRIVTTDEDGRFDTYIRYPCIGDKPDLYFWVEYSIGGIWTTVYHPPIPCNVWWNYACGTEVMIRVTDPRVSGCGTIVDVPGKVVIVKSIGRQVSMGEIGRDAAPDDPAKAGTVKPGWPHATRESPFGGVLEPRVDFGSGLVPAGITHYRWSKRTLGSTDENDWDPLPTDVHRHYREFLAAPGDPPTYKSVLVGPDPAFVGEYLFLIEPVLPAGGEDWESLDDHYDHASAYWNTAGPDLGKYELKLELFRNVGGTMTRVNLTADGVTLHQVVDPAPLIEGAYVTAPAPPDRQLHAAGNLVGFRLVLHVDNRDCSGTIEPVTVAPGANDTKCGFQEYTPASLATVSFRAAHPANFAYFDFDVVRVATVLPSASASGLVDEGMVNGFSRSGDLFSKAVPVSTMFNEGLPLGETPCIRAAFGEALHVYALATNGYDRLSSYDAPKTVLGEIALRAFALTPA
ncbi:MAG TPA: hypothetical protein VFH89_15205 [Sphingomicrobium sp.]|nr:hypothetical protein [Sphingomicrobium sp.]